MRDLSVSNDLSFGCDKFFRACDLSGRPARLSSYKNNSIGTVINDPAVRQVGVKRDNTIQDNAADLKEVLSLIAGIVEKLVAALSRRTEPKQVIPDTVPPPVPPAVLPRVVPDVPAPKPEPRPVPVVADLPHLSSKRNGDKADNIWSGFRQGPDGNCVTVSAIKAAMHKFGQSPTDIFEDVRKVDSNYHVLMRDGFRLVLSTQELAAAARGSRFVGQDKGMLKDAHFLFAASAKRAQLENNDGWASRSFHAAIRTLNDGEDERGPGEGFLRLGLRKYMKRVRVGVLAAGQLGMVNRQGHSVAVINGHEEQYGNKGKRPRFDEGAIALI